MGPQHFRLVVDTHHSHADPQQQNMEDLQALYKVLFEEVILPIIMTVSVAGYDACQY